MRWHAARGSRPCLPEADLPLPGHIVADLAVDAIRQGKGDAVLIDLAVLTIEDW